jgi:predicted membrane protein
MENVTKNHHSRFRGGFVFGLFLVLAGALFCGFNFGFISTEWRPVLISWQMLVVLFGIYALFKRHFFIGIFFIIIGKFFAMPKIIEASPEIFTNLDGNFVKIYYPLLLIAVGLIFILHWIFPPKKCKCCCHNSFFHRNKRHVEQVTDATFEKNVVFGGGEYIVLDEVFKGGTINATFGGLKLDLRRTSIVEEETVVSVNAMFSGIEIFVPHDWIVVVQVNNVCSGVIDSRLNQHNTDNTKKLIVTGNSTFSGIEIKN